MLLASTVGTAVAMTRSAGRSVGRSTVRAWHARGSGLNWTELDWTGSAPLWCALLPSEVAHESGRDAKTAA
ncbi:hypothetical protein LY76DRAFT_596274 [Colletotrichum caudatum]|nr:hypothetical protein LY76DRAFT_596274 [Colletotrichum caudatum]